MKFRYITGIASALILIGVTVKWPTHRAVKANEPATLTASTVSDPVIETPQLTSDAAVASPPGASSGSENPTSTAPPIQDTSPSLAASTVTPTVEPTVEPPAVPKAISATLRYEASPNKPNTQDGICTYTFDDGATKDKWVGSRPTPGTQPGRIELECPVWMG